MQGLLVGGDTSLVTDESEVPSTSPQGRRSRGANEAVIGAGSYGGGAGGDHGRGKADGEVGGSDGTGVGGSPSNTWQSASLKGVMGSLLGGPGGAMVSNIASASAQSAVIQQLQSEVVRLRGEIEKLNELKKLQPHVEELEKNLEQAEKAAKGAEQWADEEFAVLSNKVDTITEERNIALDSLQQSREEVDRLHKQIARTATKYTNYEEKLQTRNFRIEALEKELKETNDKAIDPEEYEKLKDKVQELMGKAWYVCEF